jgi:hypothetical protein
MSGPSQYRASRRISGAADNKRKGYGVTSLWKQIITVAGTALMATAIGLPASASTTHTSLPALAGHYASTSVIPNSATSCNPNPLLAASECTTVIGHGLKVKSVSGFAVSNLPFTTLHHLHIEIYGPRGKKVKNCGEFSLSPGAQGPVCTWHNPHPNKNVRKGNWCSRVWQKVGKKKYQILSNECIPVHR